ncbi:MAG: hypothetical protein ABDH18_05370 [Aquificaceae bacterium]
MEINISLSNWSVGEALIPSEEEGLNVKLEETPGCYKPQEEPAPFVFFIDGVRRTEAVIAFQRPDSSKVYNGIFVSLCAGAIAVRHGNINLIKDSLFYFEQKKYLFTNFEQIPADLEQKIHLSGFEPRVVNQDLNLEIANQLRLCELNTAIKAVEESSKYQDSIVICDGPLDYDLSNTFCIGIIKNSRRAFVEPEILSKLKKGERSHIFVLLKDEKPYKYSWYVKLREGGLENLIRLEVFICDRKTLYRLVNASTYMLPLMSSNPFQDQRSPQNLLPISALERFLRYYLGSYGIIRSNIIKTFRA